MNRKSTGKSLAWNSFSQAWQALLPNNIFSLFTAHGNTDWQAPLLAMTAIAWSWSEADALGERFVAAREAVAQLTTRQLPTSYQGFIKALKLWSDSLIAVLLAAWRDWMRTRSATLWRTQGYVPIAVDGTRVACPRSKSNERLLCARKIDRRRATTREVQPQLWVTLLWHVAYRLPWDWRLGPYDSSEREHLRLMIPDLPRKTLLIADAGFAGYTYWSALLGAGHQFLIRVGGNVRLLKKLGIDQPATGWFALWPDVQQRRSQPPIWLRLVRVRRRCGVMYLVTSVLDESLLLDEEIARLYALRWGVEVFIRTVKQTLQGRALRSLSAENAIREMQWCLIGLMALERLAVESLLEAGELPARLSHAAARRTLQRALAGARHGLPTPELRAALARCLLDTYRRRCKTSRRYPRQRRARPTKPPQFLSATPAQKIAAHPSISSVLLK